MLASRIETPHDGVLTPAMERMAPGAVLDACREQLTDVDATQRDRWRGCAAIEALYHPGRYVRIAYALTDRDEIPQHRMWPEADIVYLHAPVREPMSRRGTLLTLDGMDFEAYRFPNDRRLRNVRKFAARSTAGDVWQGWLDQAGKGERIERETLQRHLIRYVPEQKWVVRLRADVASGDGPEPEQTRIAVRSAPPDACAALRDRHMHLRRIAKRDTPDLIVAKVIGDDVESGFFAVNWIQGKTLLEALAGDGGDRMMIRMASAINRFHGIAVPGLADLTTADIVGRVENAVADLCETLPELSDRLRPIGVATVARLSEVGTSDTVTLHNDMHFKQVRVRSKRIGILDLDRLTIGDPLIDVANFATQLCMLGVRTDHSIDAATARGWANAFLDEWGRATGRPIDAGRYRCYAVLSLVELARGMMRHLRTGWRALAGRCVDQAEAELAAVGPEAVVA